MAEADIVIAYTSGAGHTRALAEEIATGADGARLLDVEALSPAGWDCLAAAKAIVFGSPAYMGGVSAGFKAFADASADIWDSQAWRDKLAAGFTVGSHPAGDQLAILQSLAILAAQHGMIWVSQAETGAPANPDRPGINAGGSWLGLTATAQRDKALLIGQGDRETARLFGARIAAAVRRWG